MDLPEASHGAMLSPMPPLERGSVAEHLLADPPSFRREQAIADLNARIADFFVGYLTAQPEWLLAAGERTFGSLAVLKWLRVRDESPLQVAPAEYKRHQREHHQMSRP